MTDAHPFIKWAGGKKQLLPIIHQNLPDMSVIERYIEPFVGGGAVLYSLLNQYQFSDVYISDVNSQLTTLYTTIKEKPEDIIDELSELQDTYLSSTDRTAVFLSMREEYNQFITSTTDAVRQSALFIALNRTCFNGLYRVNAKGLFNVPHGRYVNPKICDEENLLAVSAALRKVNHIVNANFDESLMYVDEHTFVYCDPPYRPLTASALFTSYTENDFNDDCQKQLAEYARNVDAKGGKILLSNSDPHNTNPNDNFFDDLYDGFKIQRIPARRAINSDGSKRGQITELLISNY